MKLIIISLLLIFLGCSKNEEKDIFTKLDEMNISYFKGGPKNDLSNLIELNAEEIVNNGVSLSYDEIDQYSLKKVFGEFREWSMTNYDLFIYERAGAELSFSKEDKKFYSINFTFDKDRGVTWFSGNMKVLGKDINLNLNPEKFKSEYRAIEIRENFIQDVKVYDVYFENFILKIMYSSDKIYRMQLLLNHQ